MSTFYVSASLKDEGAVRALVHELCSRGHSISFDWTDPPAGLVRDGLAEAEILGVLSCDAVIFLCPGGRGAHCELGAALANGIPVLLCYSDDNPKKPSLFYHHPLVRSCWFAEPTPGMVADAAEGMLEEGR